MEQFSEASGYGTHGLMRLVRENHRASAAYYIKVIILFVNIQFEVSKPKGVFK
jgi:hypothetical protein